MTKYTKRTYNKEIAANEAALDAVEANLQAFNTLHNSQGKLSDAMREAWYAALNRRRELEQERKAIEQRWIMRKWNWQDHSYAELVAANND